MFSFVLIMFQLCIIFVFLLSILFMLALVRVVLTKYLSFAFSLPLFFKAIFSLLFIVLILLHIWFLYDLETIYNELIIDTSPYKSLIRNFLIDFTRADTPSFPTSIKSNTFRLCIFISKFSWVNHMICTGFTFSFLKTYCLFLLFFCIVSFFLCFYSSSFVVFLCFFIYYLISGLFFQFIFFSFDGLSSLFDWEYSALLEFTKYHYIGPYFDIIFPFDPVLQNKTIVLNYCILLDMDINVIISREFFNFTRSFIGITDVDIANAMLKDFFSKWGFALGEEGSAIFFS